MNPRNLFFAVASVIVMGATFTLMSQGLTDGVKVTLPYPVTIDDVVLEPGEYEIRRPSATNDQVLRFFSNDKMRYQTVVQTIPAEGKETPEQSKIILHHIGDKYYFDKIWMEGKTYGYEFVLPDRVRALQRELAVTVPARYQAAQAEPESKSVASTPAQPASSNSATALSSPSISESPSVSQSDRVGRQDTQDRDIPPASSVTQSSQSVSAVQSEQTAAVVQEQRSAQTPAGVDARQDTRTTTQGGRDAAVTPSENDALPATASNWFAYMLGGALLIGMAAYLRKTRTQE